MVVRFLDRQKGLALPSSISWPDGYELSFEYDSYARMVSVSDNRSQRAEFSWDDTINPEETVNVIDHISIDVDYDGVTLTPDVDIDYTNVFDASRSSGLIFTEAEVVETSTTAVMQKLSYGYDLADIYSFIPRLTSMSDSRLDENGQPFVYATFQYDTSAIDPEIMTYRASQTSYFGGFNQYDLSVITSGTSPGGEYLVTNPLGKETEYKYDLIGDIKRISQVDGIATASCLATTQSLDYTPNALPGGGTAPEGYIYERTLRNGSVTEYERDERGLILTKTEDANGASPARHHLYLGCDLSPAYDPHDHGDGGDLHL